MASIVIGAHVAIAGGAAAQQLLKGMTAAQCAAMGGRILTWTNTAGSGTSVGECLVPAPGAAGTAAPPAANRLGPAAGAAGGMLDLLKGFSDLQGNPPAPSAEAPPPPAAAPPPAGMGRLEETARGIYRLAADQSRERSYCRAAESFRLAARYFTRAGDTSGAENALFQAGLVQADCDDQQAGKAGPAGAGSPRDQRAGAGSCVPYFQKMRRMFRQNAAVCLKETRLLQSLTDMLGTDTSAGGDPSFTRASAPELFAILAADDPGWTITATRASPKCGVPLRVRAQNEAFSECARVYLCGAAAASCGLRRARQTNTSDCIPISQACLAEHPVPQMGEEGRSAGNAWEPRVSPSQPVTGAPANRSTISGPSGPGGGGSGSSGATSAR